MSVQAISWVLEYSQSTLGARLVLISIANHASHEGASCWPSVGTIAREANISERQVQRVLLELETSGELCISRGTGRGHTHNYSLPTYQQWVTNCRLLKNVKGDILAERVTSMTLKGDIVSPEPSLTVKEPSKDKTILLSQMPEWLPSEAWNGYLEMRRKIRKPLVTNRAIGQAIAKLERLMKEGDAPEQVLDQSTFNSWQGLFPIRKNGNKPIEQEIHRDNEGNRYIITAERFRQYL